MIKENGKEGSFIMKRSRKFLFVLACLLFVMAAGMCSIAPEKATAKSAAKTVKGKSSKKWVKVNGNYRYKAGKHFVRKKLKKIEGKYYYFNAKGNCRKGWTKVKKKKYYFNKKDGAALTGKQKIGKNFYIFSNKGVLQKDKESYDFENATYAIAANGKLKTGFVKENDMIRYFNPQNAMQVKSDFVLHHATYLVDQNGTMRTGLQIYQGRTIYCNPDGKWLKGVLIKTEDANYYADKQGYLVTGLYQISHATYFFDTDHTMRTGVVRIDGNLYFFEQDGKRVENSWIQTESARYYAGTNGILKRNCWFAKQFFDNNGCVAQDAVLPDAATKGQISTKILDALGAYKATKLMVVAHPDDETLWGGAHLSEGGYLVVCMTHGNDGKRRKEFENIIKASGNIGLMLTYPDEINGVRSDWSEQRAGMMKDLDTVLRYKSWSLVATHNPEGEYGHMQHKLTDRITTQAYYRVYPDGRLYYFGRHYSVKGLAQIAATLPRVSEEAYQAKESYLRLYVSQAKCVSEHDHMSPYENWVLASQWE